MNKIRLANGNIYNIENDATQYYVSMILNSYEESVAIVDDFSENNLKTFELLQGEEIVEACYNKTVINVASSKREDGAWRVNFHLADIDITAKRIAELEEMVAMLEEALVEVAALV